jgi:hypothetical protein
VLALLLLLGGMTLIILGSWSLSAETKASMTGGNVEIVLGALCFVVFAALFFAKREALFPPEE